MSKRQKLPETHAPVTKFNWEGYEVRIMQVYEQVYLKKGDRNPSPVRKKVDAKFRYKYEVRFSSIVLNLNVIEVDDIGKCIENALADVKSHRQKWVNIVIDKQAEDYLFSQRIADMITDQSSIGNTSDGELLDEIYNLCKEKNDE
jgi:hypothetical protein